MTRSYLNALGQLILFLSKPFWGGLDLFGDFLVYLSLVEVKVLKTTHGVVDVALWN